MRPALGAIVAIAMCRRAAFWVAVALLVSGCATVRGWILDDERTTSTTHKKHLLRARAGDAESQNLIGYMLFLGDGVPQHRAEAYQWFTRAAHQGNTQAMRSLAVMHHLGAGTRRDESEARRFFALAGEERGVPRHIRAAVPRFATIDQMIEAASNEADNATGERTYGVFCAGCHGLRGVAAYERSPSFALGERLEKGDPELLDAVLRGIGTMPGWRDKLPVSELRDVIVHLRRLEAQYQLGIARLVHRVPRLFFLFGPMEDNPSAYASLGTTEGVSRTVPVRGTGGMPR